MIEHPDKGDNVSITKSASFAAEIRVIILVMAGLLVATVGTQFFIWHLESSISGFWLTELIFFNLPIHFWLTGQFLPLWFLLLGVIFNLWMDRNEVRRMEGIIRFRAVGRSKEEVNRS